MVTILSVELIESFPVKEINREEFFASIHRLWDKIKNKGLKVTDVAISITDPKPFVKFKVAGKLEWFEEKIDGMDEAEGVTKAVVEG